ncbi:MAG: hypothetical protein WBR18_15580 [Anaerolineales bacterium]
MASTPRRSIDPAFLQDTSCPICGQDALQLKAMERYPDYVTCSSCESQFVLEDDGERVMYGKIPASYPRTRRFALQQWVWPEAISRRAAEERPATQGASPITPMPAPTTAEPPASLEPEETQADSPVPGEEELADQSHSEPDLEASSPTWDEDQQDEIAELKALLDEAAAQPEFEAASEQELEQLWPTATEEPEMEADTSAPGSQSEMAGEPSAELDWEQTPTEWGEPSGTDESDGAAEEPEIEEPGAPAETPEGEPPVFDYGLKDSDTEFVEEASDAFADEADEQAEADEFPAEELSDNDWFFAKSDEAATPTEFEQDFAADVFGSGQEAEAEEAAEEPLSELGVSSPFADDIATEQTSDPLPGEMEPAPAMPDWLQSSTETPEEASEPSTQSDQPGESDDLLDTLWGGTEASEEPSSEFDDAFTATGLGALVGAAEDEPEKGSSETFDLWDEEQISGEALEFEMDDDLRDLPAEPPEQEKVGQFGAEAESSWETDSGTMSAEGEPTEAEIAEMYWTGGVKSQEETAAEPAPGEVPAKLEPQEPEPGIRYRVVMGTSDVNFPGELCAHCNGAPIVSKLPVNTAVFQGSGLGDRQMVTYRVPLCANCTERAYARSEEQQTARLQAHLISVLVAMFLVVGALATRLVDFQDSVGLDLAIILVLAGMGYIIPVTFLLIRASRFPQPEDSRYVETTLRVPADTEGMETAFEWRNPIYARQFVATNQEQAVSGAMKVHEREYEGP